MANCKMLFRWSGMFCSCTHDLWVISEEVTLEQACSRATALPLGERGGKQVIIFSVWGRGERMCPWGRGSRELGPVEQPFMEAEPRCPEAELCLWAGKPFHKAAPHR